MKKMLIDATHAEETRVAVIDNNNLLIEYDYESAARRPLKGNIFLAKVTRVEPSLQAAFVNFGGNRHGFLPFSEIHPDYFRIPVADKQAILDEQKREMEDRRAAEEAEEAEEEARLLALEQARSRAEAQGTDVVEAAEPEERITDEMPQPVTETTQTTEETSEDDDDDSDEDDETEDSADDDDNDNEGTSSERVSEQSLEGQEQPVEGTPSEGAEENSEENNGERRDKGRGRWRGRDNRRGGGRGGRGRDGGAPRDGGHNRGRGGRSGGRSSFHSRRVEMVGGDGVEGDQVYRPSLRKHYKIQEVIKRGQIMLVQIVKEERGNKGAAVTTYLSLPGRYCVLMPNSPRAGGVSRKIANFEERRRMRELLRELEVPEGMSTIVRTAGMARTKPEIKRDLDYLMRLWDTIRELTLKSTAPSLVYEEGDLIKKAIRDIFGPEVEEILVAGDNGYHEAKNFMKLLMPSHAKTVQHYQDERLPLFHKHKVENQIVEISESTVRLRSGGYLVINPTEALVSVDVNSGRATKERHIEETALKTNLEAASEVARQLKLRDLGGLVVIDFIDMEDFRNNGKVERRLRDALSNDRARIQVGRISSFGLLELSRQRLNPSLTESQFQKCEHCEGSGHTRTVDAASVIALRALEAEALKNSAMRQVTLTLPSAMAVYILNHKKVMLSDIEKRFDFKVLIQIDESYAPDGFEIIVSATKQADEGDDEEGGSQQRRAIRQPKELGSAEGDEAGFVEEETGPSQPQEFSDAEDEDDVMPEDNSGNVEREHRENQNGGGRHRGRGGDRGDNRGGRNNNRNRSRGGRGGGRGDGRDNRGGSSQSQGRDNFRNNRGNGSQGSNQGGSEFEQLLDNTVSDFRPQPQQQAAPAQPAQEKPKVAAKYFTARRSAAPAAEASPKPAAADAAANDGQEGDGGQKKGNGWWNKILD